MAKPRLCFTLYYEDGYFCVSRNFNLQVVGNTQWLIENHDFQSIARSIDELIILNVGKNTVGDKDFIQSIHKIIDQCFMPVAIGGGVRNLNDANTLFNNGADKVVLNRILFDNPDQVRKIVCQYGGQSVIASIDYKRFDDKDMVFHKDRNRHLSLEEALKISVKHGAGELMINNIDRDGLGNGFDLVKYEEIHKLCDTPIILSGGGDSTPKLLEALQKDFVGAVNASHLFNFMCNGLEITREELINGGINLSKWHFDS